MIKVMSFVFVLTFLGCSTAVNRVPSTAAVTTSTSECPASYCDNHVTPVQACLGDSKLPVNMKNKFQSEVNGELLKSALGAPGRGRLCQGQVYRSKADAQIVIYRAWNSTNPSSITGQWWSFAIPSGKIALFRSDYEVCPSWSPLDKLVKCTLKSGVEVVVGTGQSACCSEYLSYPVSSIQQVYLENAKDNVENCTEFTGEFNWN